MNNKTVIGSVFLLICMAFVLVGIKNPTYSDKVIKAECTNLANKMFDSTPYEMREIFVLNGNIAKFSWGIKRQTRYVKWSYCGLKKNTVHINQDLSKLEQVLSL